MAGTAASVEQGKAAKAQTITDILARKKPNIRSIDICLDSDLAAEIQALEREIDQAKRKRGKSLADGTARLEVQLDELYERAAAESVTFTFQDIGRKAFDELVMAHPATKDQKERVAELGGGILEYNIDTFPPALLAATAIDPEMTVEDAQQIFDVWGSGDAEILFTQALLVCKERTSVPLSRNGTGPTVDSDLRSNTVPSEE